MTDETPEKKPRRPRPVPPGDAPPSSAAGGAPDDPDAALRRLESMGTRQPASPAPAASSSPSEPLPPQPAVDAFVAPPATPTQRPVRSSGKTSGARPRPAGSRSSLTVARIAAPVVFLVAVIVFVGIVVNSGVIGGSDQPVVRPTVKATKTTKATNGGAKTTKTYVVKSGDSLSSIAVRFSTSTSTLRDLNPDIGSSSTLVVGQRIVVPAQ